MRIGMRSAFAVLAVGVALMTAGVALVFVPAALFLAGVALVAFVFVVADV